MRLFPALVLGASILAPHPAWSQAPAKAPKVKTKATPMTAPVKVTSVEGITEYRLGNGLRVLLFPDPSKANITTNITYMVGSRHENYGETGMAHLLEHLVFKPSKKYHGKDGQLNIVQTLNKVGARFNGTTWLDRTNYFVTFPATDAHLDLILDMEADRMINANIDQKDLWDPVEKKGEMTVVRNEMEGGENNPFRVTLQRTVSAAYEWHNYGKSTIGARSDVENVNIERLRDFYRKYYQPDNAVLLVAGKIDEAQTLAVINRKFGGIPKPSRIIQPTYTLDPTQDGERSVTVRRVGDMQMLMAAYKIPAGTHLDSAALDVLGQVMGDTPSGRLHKALVDTKKAAAVFPFIMDNKEPGLAIFGAQIPKDGNLDEAREAFLKAVEQGAEAITQEDVDRARQQILKEIDLTLNEADRLGVGLSEFISQGDWRLFFLQRDRVRKVTLGEIRAAAAKYFKRENRTLGQFIPTATPDRAEIPAAPDALALVQDYKGGERVAQGESFEATPTNIDARTRRFETPSGLKATLLAKKTRGETVSATLNLHFGSEASLMGHDTAGSLAASMLMRGSSTRTRQEIQDAFDKIKAQVDMGGDAENLRVTMTTTRPNLAAMLEIVADVLQHPAFNGEEFGKLVSEQTTMIESQKNEPTYRAQIALRKHVTPFPKGHPRYPSSVEESLAELKAAKVEEVAAFHKNFYGGTGELAIVGDFDDKALEGQVRKLFGTWKAPQAFQRIPQRLKEGLQPMDAKHETPDKAQAFFLALQPLAMKDSDPDYPAMLIGNYLLGGGSMNSRIANRLRQKEGLCYGAGSQFNAGALDSVGQWMVYAIYAPQNLARLEKAFNEEMALALKDGFTEKEISDAKTSWLQSQATGRTQDRELGNRLAANLFNGRSMAWYGDLETKVKALTNEQILAALRARLDMTKLIRSKAGDFAKAEKDATVPASK